MPRSMACPFGTLKADRTSSPQALGAFRPATRSRKPSLSGWAFFVGMVRATYSESVKEQRGRQIHLSAPPEAGTERAVRRIASGALGEGE